MSKEYETLKFTQKVYEKEIAEIVDMYQKDVKELQDEVWNLRELVSDIQAAASSDSYNYQPCSAGYCSCEDAVTKVVEDYEGDL